MHSKNHFIKMEALESDMASSDLILVTDGELPNPPVSNLVMSKLKLLQQQTGLEVHGLLVGKRESESLDMLCDEVHTFLDDYETSQFLKTRAPTLALSSVSRHESHDNSKTSRSSVTGYGFARAAVRPFRRQTSRLFATMKPTDTMMRHNKKQRRRNAYDDDDDDWDFTDEDDDPFTANGRSSSSSTQPYAASSYEEKSPYLLQVEQAVNFIDAEADKSLVGSAIDFEESSWSKRQVVSETIKFIESGLVERDIEARLVVLGMISQVRRKTQCRMIISSNINRFPWPLKEHVLFIGPPGTSKSEIGRRLSQLCGGPFFQRLFTRFTTTEEIFGPLSLRALENDQYIRCIDGYLPTATGKPSICLLLLLPVTHRDSVAFLDEIFKANSSILNTLLTILNERQVGAGVDFELLSISLTFGCRNPQLPQFDNGGTRVACPLKCVIGASNELPESEELDALLDRFLLRSFVSSVSDEGLLQILASKPGSQEPEVNPNTSTELDNVVREMSSSIENISLPPDICELLKDLRVYAREEVGIYVSDRRLVKAARLLKISAATHGRTQVDLVDCLILQHILWQIPEQREAIREWLWDNLTPGSSANVVDQTSMLLQNLSNELIELVKSTSGDVSGAQGARKPELEAIASINYELQQLKLLLQDHVSALTRHISLVKSLGDHLWIGNEEASSAEQHLLPIASESLFSAKDTLKDIVSIQLGLSDKVEDEVRLSVLESITDIDSSETSFSDEEMAFSLKEAKKQFKGETLKQWKRARKEL